MGSVAGRAQHVVYVSVVGVYRIPVVSGIDRTVFGDFGSKLAAERVVADSGRGLRRALPRIAGLGSVTPKAR